MTTENSTVPTWFWVMAVLAVLWNAMGVMAYIADVSQTAADLAKQPQIVQELYAARPAWVVGAFAVAVFGGLLGSFSLLLRRKIAVPLLVLSLVALVVQDFWWFGIAKSYQHFSVSSQTMPVLVFVIAVCLVWFARSSAAKGWLR